MNDNSLKLFKYFFDGILTRWIPGLEYKLHLTEKEIISSNQGEGEDYSTELRCHNHFVCIDDCHIRFSGTREIRGDHRALIDWSIGKAYQYGTISLDYQLEHSLNESISRWLIATYLCFPALNLNNPWKQFGKHLYYFGATEEHYETDARDPFSQDELTRISRTFDILYSVEMFATSTNEGSKFPFCLAVVNNKDSTIEPIFWNDLIKKQFIRSLSSENILFIINGNGEYLDYKHLRNNNLPEWGEFLTQNERVVPGQESISKYIIGQQISKPEEDIFVLSVKENGDIFLFKNSLFNFFKRKGVWHYFNHDSILKLFIKVAPCYYAENSTDQKPIFHRADDDLINTIVTLLIEEIGCCIGIIPPDKWNKNFNSLMEGEVDSCIKSSPSIDPVFWKNDIEVRKKLLSIDGAVLIDSETGKILRVGSIIPNNGNSSKGARTVATEQISALGGLAIKISDDGYCSIYEPSETGQPSLPYIIGR